MDALTVELLLGDFAEDAGIRCLSAIIGTNGGRKGLVAWLHPLAATGAMG